MTAINLSPPNSERWRQLTSRLERVRWPHSGDLLGVVLDLAIGHLEALRDSLEGVRTPTTSWQSPWLEAQYPVAWDWARHRRHFSSSSSAQSPTADELADLDSWGEELAGNATFSMFHFLTHGLALLREGGLFEPLISVEVMERLATVPAAHQQSQLETELQGTWFSDPQVMSLSGTTRAGDFGVAVVVQMHPLLIDADSGRVHYPVVTGLDLRGTTPQRWPAPERGAFWGALLSTLRDHAVILGEAAHEREAAQLPLALPDLPKPEFRPQRTFPLVMGPAMVDRGVMEVTSAAVHTRGLFRRWSELPRLDEEVRRTAARVYEEEGLQGLQRRKGGLRQGSDGQDEPYLAADAKAVKDLMLEHGLSTGYRRVEESVREVLATGGVREYACRVFRTARGYVEIGLSWTSLAGPWVDEWHEEMARQVHHQEQRISELQREVAESLFPDLHTQEVQRLQRLVDQATQSVTIWRRGHQVMGLLLSQVYHQRSNWVVIPAEAFRMALWDVEGSEPPRDWKQEVDNVLASLATVSFTVRGLYGESIRGFGRFLGEVWYEDHPILVRRGDEDHPPQPPQAVEHGQYLLDVQPGFVGCLRAFQAGEKTLDGPPDQLLFDWAKRLSGEDRLLFGGGRKADSGDPRPDPYMQFDPARFLAHGARSLSTTQRALDDCLERELTLNWHSVPGKRRRAVPNHHGRQERLYTHEDCELLPPGREFVLAGGNGKRAGGSYTVGGSVSRQRRGGWLEMVGGYPADLSDARKRSAAVGQFVDDLRTVVEDFYGGVVAGYREGQWLSMEQIRQERPQTLLALNLRPFLPADYHERRRQIVRDRGIEVYDTSEQLTQAQRRTQDISPDQIRAARKARGVTQEQLAELLEVRQSMVSQIETGRRPIPDELIPRLREWLQRPEQ